MALLDSSLQVTWRQQTAHDWPVNRLHHVSETILASGDDQGVVKVRELVVPRFDSITHFPLSFVLHTFQHFIVSCLYGVSAIKCVFDLLNFGALGDIEMKCFVHTVIGHCLASFVLVFRPRPLSTEVPRHVLTSRAVFPANVCIKSR